MTAPDEQTGVEPPAPPLQPPPPLPVQVVRSPRRQKTVSARVVGGAIRVAIPASMSKADEDRYVGQLVGRLERRRSRAATRTDQALHERAVRLARRYELPEPAAIRWTDRQQRRWGSCTPATGEIRISATIAHFPDWVVDYVIVHELAHLLEQSHNRRFWRLVDRYPKAERARGYLIAKGLGEESAEPGEAAG